MNEKTAFYILFEEAEDGCYGDFLADRWLFSKTEMDAYVKENATNIFPVQDVDIQRGIRCCFKAKSRNEYGTGVFRFVEIYRR